MTVREVRLDRIPGSRIVPADLRVVDRSPEPLGPGEVRVRTRMIGLNAGLKHRLGTGRSTALGPALGVGDVPRSDVVAVVTESDDPRVSVGDDVVGLLPWAEENVVAADLVRVTDQDDPVRHLTLLGHVGLTAHVALFTIGRLAPGETVWISAAAGGVGSCAVQLALACGATVVASASGEDRLAHLRRLGVDRVVDRRLDLEPQLRDVAPDGLDVYLDSVGGDHVRVALPLMREQGRIVAVGRVGSLEHEPVLPNTSMLISRRLTLAGFSVTDHEDQRPALEQRVAAIELAQHRRLTPAATISHGLESVPDAFCDLLAGRTLGRGIVDLERPT